MRPSTLFAASLALAVPSVSAFVTPLRPTATTPYRAVARSTLSRQHGIHMVSQDEIKKQVWKEERKERKNWIKPPLPRSA